MSRNEKFWDKVSGRSKAPEKITNRTSLSTLEKSRQHLHPQFRALDFGCGNGVLTNELSADVNSIHAIDISSGMIQNAIENATHRDITNIEYRKSDIFNDELKAGSFDVVWSFSVLHHIDNDSGVIHRIHKLLKPSGLFISTTPCIGQKKLAVRFLLSFLMFIKLVPPMSKFSVSELEDFVRSGNRFELIDNQELSELPERFIVARKVD